MTVIWGKIESYSDNDFFYSMMLGTSIIGGSLIAISNKNYEDMLFLDLKHFHK